MKNSIRKGIDQIKSKIPDSTWLKINKNFFGLEKDIFVCVTYRKPSSLKECQEYFDMLEEEFAQCSTNNFGLVCFGLCL